MTCHADAGFAVGFQFGSLHIPRGVAFAAGVEFHIAHGVALVVFHVQAASDALQTATFPFGGKFHLLGIARFLRQIIIQPLALHLGAVAARQHEMVTCLHGVLLRTVIHPVCFQRFVIALHQHIAFGAVARVRLAGGFIGRDARCTGGQGRVVLVGLRIGLGGVGGRRRATQTAGRPAVRRPCRAGKSNP